MFNITETIIKNQCENIETYKRGQRYFERQAVEGLKLFKDRHAFEAQVMGNHDYLVRTSFSPSGELKSASCECPAYHSYRGFCKHIVAVLFKIRNEYGGRNLKKEKTSQVLLNMLKLVNLKQPENQKISLVLEPTISLRRIFRNELLTGLSLKLGEKKTYVVKDIEKFFDAMKAQEPLVFGKNFIYDPSVHFFSDNDQALIEIIREIYEINKLLSSGHNYYSNREKLIDGKEILLSQTFIQKTLSAMKEKTFALDLFGQKHEAVNVLEEDLPLSYTLTKENNELILNLDLEEGLVPLDQDGQFFFYGGSIYSISPNQQENLSPFYYGFAKLGSSITISEEYQEAFISELYPSLKKSGHVDMDSEVQESLFQEPLEAEIYLDEEDGLLTVEIKYSYGEHSFNPIEGKRKLELQGRILVRDTEKERNIMRFFEDAEFKVKGQGRTVYLDDEDKVFEFLYESLPELHQEAQVYYSNRFKINSVRPAPSIQGRVGLNSDNNLLEVSFELEGVSTEELIEVFDSLKEKRKFYRLKDGSFLPLASDNLQEMVELIDTLDLRKADLKEEIISLPKYRSIQVDQFFQENKLKTFKREKAFKELTRNLREPHETDYEVPVDLEPILRDYQKSGFNWLKTMATYGFGGILADDMGLGKTLQAIAFICSEKAKEKGTVLVVAPTSVIYNWQAEIEKFAPALKAEIISGTKTERAEKLEAYDDFDIIITSYALLRKDMDIYQDKKFSYLILDEAQYIKNPSSLTAKAAKQIAAKNVFALTGTPIENSLTELWSIFDCLMPGYLASYKKFMEKFGKAAEKEDNEKAATDLAKKVNPFILRRLKKDVLKELPEKIELNLMSELTKDQKKLYMAYLEKTKKEMATEIHQHGFDKSRLKMLAAITRLRQICCHPGLFIEDYKGDSGKLLQLKEVVTDALAGGHRVLIFSQFTQMLKMIGQMLEKEKLDYFYLDGSIKSEKRLDMVNAFNSGANWEQRDLGNSGGKNIFLISLKAGGTGLNLTGADTVIHFDLWWNPAVEDQASDRAYRLGQKRSVQVMKLISLGTIEEKIYALQQRKKELIDRIITPGEQLVTSLSEADLKELLEM